LHWLSLHAKEDFIVLNRCHIPTSDAAATQESHPAPLPDRFPHRHGGTVTIVMKNGQRHSNTCKAPRGSGPRGVDWADVDAKCRHLMPSSGLAPRAIEESLERLHGFEAVDDVSALTVLLTP
jgi:2-methylcitrate dehydratase PrpD